MACWDLFLEPRHLRKLPGSLSAGGSDKTLHKATEQEEEVLTPYKPDRCLKVKAGGDGV